jgi:DEAD/DEAH box helicase domain-containing protein
VASEFETPAQDPRAIEPGHALRAFLDDLRRVPSERLGGRMVHLESLPPEARVTTDVALPPELAPILERRGIDELYVHQASALDAHRSGHDVVVATATASGKSLIYNLAVALRSLEDREARALFLFPLKALERDQLAGLRADFASISADEAPTAEIYDGDTSPYRRRRIRESPPTVLISTPDMLHVGLLPAHARWRNFLSRLELIVLDEVHTYRGVFGSQTAQVLRRLLRVARYHGADPRVVACSATIGNPGPFYRKLVGRDAVVLEEDGAPKPIRHYAFFSPEVSPYTLAARLFRHCVSTGLRTIAFTQSRRITELIHTWVLEAAPELAPRVSSYRSGFLPEERRTIEERLFRGELGGVISTSALELGIDVGGLDVCLLVGYPGTVLATRQRAGRVGRGRAGVVLLVPQEDALDRYMVDHPRILLDHPPEDAILDPANLEVLRAHLPCAATELPLTEDEPWLADPDVRAAVDEVTRQGNLLESAAGGEWVRGRAPAAREFSLRSIGEAFTIRRRTDGKARVIGTIGAGRAYSECHPGAIYLHRAQAYRVTRLDLERREAEVEGPVRVDHYTRALADKETEILEVHRSRPLGNALLRQGRLRVTTRFKRYEKRRVFGQDLLGTYPLDLPSLQFETEGLWIEVAREVEPQIRGEEGHFMGGLHGVEHAALALIPLLALCDRLDMAGISTTSHPQVRGPAVFLYDGQPGGIGVSRALFDRAEELLEATRSAIASCECEQGCPGCIHSPRCGSGNRPLDKRAAKRVLDLVLSDEPLPARRVQHEPPLPPLLEAPLPTLREPRVIFFDVETQRSAEEVGGWHNTHLMRLALAVVYELGADRFDTYLEADASKLIDRLFEADLVVGFNIQRFDYEVLRAYTPRSFQSLPTFDLLLELHRKLGHRVSLGHLAESTLGRPKGGDGLQSIEWFRSGQIERVEEYCRLDVELLRDLIAFGEREGHVLIQKKNGPRVRVPFDWNLNEIALREEAPAK